MKREISEKVQEMRVKSYRHAVRGDEEYVGRREMRVAVQGRRRSKVKMIGLC